MKISAFLVIFLLVSMLNGVSAQEVNPDSLFLEVKKSAEEKKYDEAITQIQSLISTYPENLDYSIYLAHLYFWAETYDLAQKQIFVILSENPTNEETFSLLIKLELGAKKYSELLLHCEQGLSLFPKEQDFYKFSKAQALEGLNKNEEAIVVLNEIQKTSDLHKDAQYLKTQILKKQKNVISLGYLNTSFSNPGFAPWHFGQIQYLRKVQKNAYIGRLNYANLFGISALQAEVDAYLQIKSKNYVYLNAGFSDGKSLFPLLRLGGEFYQDSKRISFSLGSRYLHFSASKVLMFTGHLGLNFKKEWRLAYRPFFVYQNKEWFPSHILNLRKSFESKESYVQVDVQYGGMPYYFFTANEFSRINSWRVGLDSKFRIKDNFFVQTTFMYELEEFVPEKFRNRYNVQVTLSKRF